MFRRFGISARLNYLLAVFSVALIGVVLLGYLALHARAGDREQLNRQADATSAAQTLQYDVADVIGRQSAYALSVSQHGASASADTAQPRKDFLESVARSRSDLAALKSLSGAGVDEATLAAIDTGLNAFTAVDDQAATLYRRGDPTSKVQADALISGQARTTAQAVTDNLQKVVTQLQKARSATARAADAAGNNSVRLNLLLGLAALILITLLAYAIGRSVLAPLRELTDASDRLAQGDFEFTVDTTGTDEPGQAL